MKTENTATKRQPVSRTSGQGDKSSISRSSRSRENEDMDRAGIDDTLQNRLQQDEEGATPDNRKTQGKNRKGRE